MLKKNDFELTKFKVYDSLLNELNSSTNVEEFIDSISKTKDIDYERVKRYLNERSFNGYDKVEKIDLGTREIITTSSSNPIVKNIFEDEKNQYPEVIYWQTNNISKDIDKIMLERRGVELNTKFSPYPNFDKKYTVLWNTKDELLDKLSSEWIKEIIWFYETSLQAINNGCFKDNNQFPTGSEKEDNRRIEDMSKMIKDKSFEQISKDYECEYNGDLFDFMSKRWDKKKNEYESFINEMLEVLNDSLSQKNEIKFER